MSDNELKVITKISWLYYVNDYTQQDIADKMNISRTKVTRYLQKARSLGIVNISVSMEHNILCEKEEQLKKLLNLQEVTLIPSASDEDSIEHGVGVAGAIRLSQILSADDVLGVAWGKSLYNVAKNLVPVKPKNKKVIEVVQLMGGLTISDKINPEEIVKLIARRLNAQGYWLNVPTVVSSKETYDVLMNDVNLQKVFSKMHTCNKCILGIGNLTESSSVYITGTMNKQDLIELKEAGSVGDIVGRPYDINGNPINTSLTERLIGISLNDIKEIKNRIAVAVGAHKVPSIIGASRGGFINELITDENTADQIIETIQKQ